MVIINAKIILKEVTVPRRNIFITRRKSQALEHHVERTLKTTRTGHASGKKAEITLYVNFERGPAIYVK